MPFPHASKAPSRFTVLDLTRVRSGPTCVRQLAGRQCHQDRRPDGGGRRRATWGATPWFGHRIDWVGGNRQRAMALMILARPESIATASVLWRIGESKTDRRFALRVFSLVSEFRCGVTRKR
jgi:hypothetical protein